MRRETETRYYTSGQFAKKANVTIRTIRFYDKQGILKPSRVDDNGYRLYTDEDFGRLQKILSLKYLGFSLEEIMAMTINDDEEDMAHSLEMQRELIRKRIRHLQMMEQTLEDTSRIVETSGRVDWNDILNLIHITNMEHAIVEQYKTAVNLNVRIALHQRFSHNSEPWFAWLAGKLPLVDHGRYLEVGCGNGQLWQYVDFQKASGMEIHVTDVSSGMVEDAARLLSRAGIISRFGEKDWRAQGMTEASGKKADGMTAVFWVSGKVEENRLVFEAEDCQKLSYGDELFDVVIANHVLFYVKNLSQALSEVCRVLKPHGEFHCSTYGRGHMKEITSLVQEFDSRISLSEVALYELFGLDEGQVMLEKYFQSVEKVMYEDYLLVDEAEPLLDYILSCHGNQSEILSQRQLEFKTFLQRKIEEKGGIRITKEAGVFICRERRL